MYYNNQTYGSNNFEENGAFVLNLWGSLSGEMWVKNQLGKITDQRIGPSKAVETRNEHIRVPCIFKYLYNNAFGSVGGGKNGPRQIQLDVVFAIPFCHLIVAPLPKRKRDEPHPSSAHTRL
jgi:hypothetical protein